MGMSAPGQGAAADPNFAPIIVTAVIEVKKTESTQLGPTSPKIEHKFGKTILWQDGTTVTWFRMDMNGKPVPTVRKRFEEQRKETMKDKPTSDKLLELAEWALNHALLPEFTKTMDDLAQLDKDHPSAKAYLKVKEDIARPLPDNPDATRWREQLLRDYRVTPSPDGHYALLYKDATPEDVTSRLKRLEDTYRAFFYWFALKGHALRMPERRLLAVLVSQKPEFERQHQIFDDVPLVADGFFARRDNLVVMSNERLDEAYESLKKSTSSLWITYDRSKLLKAQGRVAIPQAAPLASELQWAKAQTLALVLRALDEESEIATTTYEGTRQLLAATGTKPGSTLLPRAVEVPQWVEFGMGSFFGTPKGAPWQGIACPSPTVLEQYKYLENYKQAYGRGKLDKAPVALLNVASDHYSREAMAVANKEKAKSKEKEKEKDKDREKLQKETELALSKARTMSWALTYFLAQKKLDGLLRYFDELSRLPRDLDLDEDTLRLAFARSFDLVSPAQPNQVDATKAARLAAEWQDYILRVPLEYESAIKEAKKKTNEFRGDPTTTGAPKPGG